MKARPWKTEVFLTLKQFWRPRQPDKLSTLAENRPSLASTQRRQVEDRLHILRPLHRLCLPIRIESRSFPVQLSRVDCRAQRVGLLRLDLFRLKNAAQTDLSSEFPAFGDDWVPAFSITRSSCECIPAMDGAQCFAEQFHSRRGHPREIFSAHRDSGGSEWEPAR